MHVCGGAIFAQAECVKLCARAGISDHQRVAFERIHPAPPRRSAPGAKPKLAMFLVEQHPIRLRCKGGAALESSCAEACVLDLASKRPRARKLFKQALSRGDRHLGTLARRGRENFSGKARNHLG